MVHLQTWFFSEFTGWRKIYTDDFLETKDEEKYFRVMRNGTKEFYYNSMDYLKHIDNLEGLNEGDIIRDKMGNFIKKCEPTIITDITGSTLKKM